MLLALGWMAAEPVAARSRHHHSDTAPVEETVTKPKGALAATQVPLPQPRPAEAPSRAAAESAKGKDAPDKGKDNGKEEAAGPPPPSACRLALTDEIAVAPSIPSIHGPGACGGDDLVRLEAVVLPDKTRVALTPPGIMRCTMATAVVNWIRNDVAPEVAKLGSEIRALDNFDSFECRGRNGVPGATLSEHGKANAIDVHGFKLADGRMIELTDRTQPREFREAVLHSACTRFPTVLGPDSDWHHEDHIHLDLIERRSNYRICQWDVLDPMPKVAPLLPEVRPGDAPPREVAEAAGPGTKSKDQADGKGDAKRSVMKNGEPRTAEPRTAEPKTAEPKTAEPKTADDHRPDDKSAAKAAVAADKDRSEAKPASPAPRPKTASADSADKPKEESRPTAAARPSSKAATESAAKDQAPADHAASKPTASTDKTSADKSAAEKSSSDKPVSEKAPEKASRKKIAAEKPRRHRHRSRMWNPFAGFF
jgi:hypothetical protein